MVADDINKECIMVGDCTSDADCAAGDACVDCTCQTLAECSTGSDCGECMACVNGTCQSLGCASDAECPTGEECVNCQCEPVSGGGGGTFDPSLVSLQGCSGGGSVEEEGEYTLDLTISNGNGSAAETGVTVNVGQTTVVDGVVTVSPNATETFTYRRNAFLQPGDYDINASISNPTEAAVGTSFRTHGGFHQCDAGFEWDPVAEECVAVSSGDSYPDWWIGGGGDPTCPEDYEWNPIEKTCIYVGDVDSPTQPQCPEGEFWDPLRKRCISSGESLCPDGYVFSATAMDCVPQEDATDDDVVCPGGYSYDPQVGECTRDVTLADYAVPAVGIAAVGGAYYTKKKGMW